MFTYTSQSAEFEAGSNQGVSFPHGVFIFS